MQVKTALQEYAWVYIPLLLSISFFFVSLGNMPLEDADEATYAMVAREMTESGNILKPVLWGSDWIDKPPLHFWMMIASAKVFGWNEFALRFPSALAGALAVLFTIGITFELVRNKEAAAVSGVILTLFPLFLGATRNLRMDVPVTAMVLGSLYFFIKGRTHPVFLLGIGPALALGFLSKSVIVLLSTPVIGIYAFMYRSLSFLRQRYFWYGLGIGALVVLPWFIYAGFAYGSSFYTKFFGFQVGRIFTNSLNSLITNDYIFEVFKIYGAPWSYAFLILAAVSALIWLMPKLRVRLFGYQKTLAFIFLSALCIALPFLVSVTKLATYFIPTYPFIAIFLGTALAAGVTSGFAWKWTTRALFLVLGLVGLAASLPVMSGNTILYNSEKTTDEHAIALKLRGTSSPIFIYEFPHDQTIQYYARRRVNHINKASQNLPPGALYLIIPTERAKLNPAFQILPEYQGKILSLYKITN